MEILLQSAHSLKQRIQNEDDLIVQFTKLFAVAYSLTPEDIEMFNVSISCALNVKHAGNLRSNRCTRFCDILMKEACEQFIHILKQWPENLKDDFRIFVFKHRVGRPDEDIFRGQGTPFVDALFILCHRIGAGEPKSIEQFCAKYAIEVAEKLIHNIANLEENERLCCLKAKPGGRTLDILPEIGRK